MNCEPVCDAHGRISLRSDEVAKKRARNLNEMILGTPTSIPATPSNLGVGLSSVGEFKSNNGEMTNEFVCHYCDASFKVRGYLTRHIKKHAAQKAFRCPFYDRVVSMERRCHATGGFSRRDTYKTHLRVRHFVYPEGVKPQDRARSSGHCAHCHEQFENAEGWIEMHIEAGFCKALPKDFLESLKNGRKPNRLKMVKSSAGHSRFISAAQNFSEQDDDTCLQSSAKSYTDVANGNTLNANTNKMVNSNLNGVYASVAQSVTIKKSSDVESWSNNRNASIIEKLNKYAAAQNISSMAATKFHNVPDHMITLNNSLQITNSIHDIYEDSSSIPLDFEQCPIFNSISLAETRVSTDLSDGKDTQTMTEFAYVQSLDPTAMAQTHLKNRETYNSNYYNSIS